MLDLFAARGRRRLRSIWQLPMVSTCWRWPRSAPIPRPTLSSGILPPEVTATLDRKFPYRGTSRMPAS